MHRRVSAQEPDSNSLVVPAVAFRESWIDRLTSRVERLPLPPPLLYAILAVVSVLLFVVNDWLNTGLLVGALKPFHLVLALEPVYTVALIHLLNHRAGRALDRMEALLVDKPADSALVHRQLTSLPAMPTLVVGLCGLVVGIGAAILERFGLPAVFDAFIWPGSGRFFLEAWLILTWVLFGVLFYHTFHQLRLINHIYTQHTRIDLDHYQPLFHFSTVSALTAIGLLLIPYGWYVTVPDLVSDPAGVLFGALFPIFALISFLWPLVGVHGLLVEAKERALWENARMLKEGRADLYHRVESQQFVGASEVHDALAAVRAEREALVRVPTWPWQPGTFRGVVAALLLPLAVWLLQWALQKVLGL